MNAIRSKRLALFDRSKRTAMTEAERAFAPIADEIHAQHQRPRYVYECLDEPKPCPWAGCRFNLALSVNENGTITVHYPAKGVTDQIVDWDAMPATCLFEVLKPGEGLSQEDIATILNMSPSNIRAIVDGYMKRARAELDAREMLGGPEAPQTWWETAKPPEIDLEELLVENGVIE